MKPAKPHTSHSTLLICGVTRVTGVTALIYKGFFCNPARVTGVTRVTKLHPKRHRPRRCATVQTGAEYTTDTAVFLPVSEVFSRPEFMVLGRDGAHRKAARMAVSMYSTSRHQLHRLNNSALVFSSYRTRP